MAKASREDLALAIGLLQACYSDFQSDDPSPPTAKVVSQVPAVRYLLDSIPAWLWQTDADHKFIFVSQHFEEQTGISIDRFLGNTRSDVMEAEVATPFNLQEHNSLLASNKSIRNFHYDIKGPDDQVVSVSISGWPLWEEDSTFRGYMGIGVEISNERSRILDSQIQDIVTQRTFLGEAMNALDVSVLILDDLHKIEYYNRRWKELHEAMPRSSYRKGVPYIDYIRSAISLGLFPDAINNEEPFIQERINKNLIPPSVPFKVRRQDNILLSIYVTRIGGGKTAIISTELATAGDYKITA